VERCVCAHHRYRWPGTARGTAIDGIAIAITCDVWWQLMTIDDNDAIAAWLSQMDSICGKSSQLKPVSSVSCEWAVTAVLMNCQSTSVSKSTKFLVCALSQPSFLLLLNERAGALSQPSFLVLLNERVESAGLNDITILDPQNYIQGITTRLRRVLWCLFNTSINSWARTGNEPSVFGNFASMC
jgi:hypothetical protein